MRLLLRLASAKDRERFHSGELGRIRLVARVALRFKWVYVGLLALSAAVTLGTGMDIYHRTEAPAFCSSCHEMRENFSSWRDSVHGSVRCIDCHARPGILGWMGAKYDGLTQLVNHFSAETLADIRAHGETLEITNANCQRCHPGAVRLDERGGLVISHSHHLDKGVGCISCHAGSFVHPDPLAPPVASTKLVDTLECFECHDGVKVVGGALAFDSTPQESCVRCHPDSMLSVAHGLEHTCDECHGEAPPGGHFAPAGEGALCLGCHEAEEGHASVHEPFGEGKCRSCHEVMSPERLYGPSSRPTTALCLGCHEEMAKLLAAEAPTDLSRFSADDLDLHREHAEWVGDEEAYCLQCHAAHGSKSPTAMVALAPDEEGAPAVFTPTDSGGSCAGGCHADDERTYVRAVAK